MASSGSGSSPAFDGAVLAGGSSTRMGRDKAFIRLDGATLLERVAAAVREAGASRVVVIGGDADRVGRLHLEHVPDLHPQSGPLGGVITALHHLSAEAAVVLACDHLDPSPGAIRAVVTALGSADAAIPLTDGGPQWLHAAWRRSILPTLAAAHQRGLRAPRDVADELEIEWVNGIDPRCFADADRPGDLPDAAS